MPSLVAMLVAVAIAFFVIPRLAPSVLIVVSSLVLAGAVFMHYDRFGVTEYERATWMYNIKQYTGFIIFGVILLGGYGFLYMQKQSGSGSSNISMPALNMPTVGGGMGVVAKTVSSRIRELMQKGRISID